MSELLVELENLRGIFEGKQKELEILETLIRMARELEDGEIWHGLQVQQLFKPLSGDQVASILANPGPPQIIVKGDPPAQATYFAYPVPPNGGNPNGNGTKPS